MVTATAVTALLISIISLAFGIYQYRVLQRIRVGERRTSLLRFAYDLRRKSEDIKHAIGSTDDVDDCEELLGKISVLIEGEISAIATTGRTSLENLFEIERGLLPLELELDLMHKQIVEAGKFNEEFQVHETRSVEHRGS